MIIMSFAKEWAEEECVQKTRQQINCSSLFLLNISGFSFFLPLFFPLLLPALSLGLKTFVSFIYINIYQNLGENTTKPTKEL